MEAIFVPIIEGDSALHEIRPDDIRMEEHSDSILGTFGKCEVERSAGRLVRFFQSKGRWCNFTFSELARFYEQNNWDLNEMLFGLMGVWYDDGGLGGWRISQSFVGHTGSKLCVSDMFIKRCAGKIKATS